MAPTAVGPNASRDQIEHEHPGGGNLRTHLIRRHQLEGGGRHRHRQAGKKDERPKQHQHQRRMSDRRGHGAQRPQPGCGHQRHPQRGITVTALLQQIGEPAPAYTPSGDRITRMPPRRIAACGGVKPARA